MTNNKPLTNEQLAFMANNDEIDPRDFEYLLNGYIELKEAIRQRDAEIAELKEYKEYLELLENEHYWIDFEQWKERK